MTFNQYRDGFNFRFWTFIRWLCIQFFFSFHFEQYKMCLRFPPWIRNTLLWHKIVNFIHFNATESIETTTTMNMKIIVLNSLYERDLESVNWNTIFHFHYYDEKTENWCSRFWAFSVSFYLFYQRHFIVDLNTSSILCILSRLNYIENILFLFIADKIWIKNKSYNNTIQNKIKKKKVRNYLFTNTIYR